MMVWLRFLLIVAVFVGVKGGMLKIRVDDEVKIYIDGKDVYNEFTVPRWQWEELAEIPFDDNVKILAFRMYNQGPRRLGYGKGEIDGKDLFSSGIVCKDVPKKQDPDAFFPGWFEEDYGDSDWTPPVAVESHPTEGILADAQGFWGAHKSTKIVLCRLKLGDQGNFKGCESVDKDEQAESSGHEPIYHVVKGEPASQLCRVNVPLIEDRLEASDYTVATPYLNLTELPTGLIYNVHDLDNFEFIYFYGVSGADGYSYRYVSGWMENENLTISKPSTPFPVSGALVGVSVTITPEGSLVVRLYDHGAQRTQNVPGVPDMHYEMKVAGGIVVVNREDIPIPDAHVGRVVNEELYFLSQ